MEDITKPEKMYAIVGNWGFVPGCSKGLSVYSYDPETSAMELIENVFPDVYVGQQCIDNERNIVYIVNEIGSRRGETGGGGYVVAFRIDPENGKVTLINEKESLSPEPSYICLDKSKKYALVTHHVDGGYVTKIIREKDGSFSSQTLFDDSGLVLFRINEDGSLGDVCDVSIKHGEGASGPHMISRGHSVVSDPTGELFAVSDKGLDKIFTYHLDRENGKLICLQETSVEIGSGPRYGAFHPKLPIFYVNNEHKPFIYAFHYDILSGKLDQTGSTSVLQDENATKDVDRVEAGDIKIHPNGKYMYVTIRGLDYIAVMDIMKQVN